MRRLTTLAVIATALLCGCAGNGRHPVPPGGGQSRTSLPAQPAQSQTCHPRTPPSAGECVAQHYGFPRGQTPQTGVTLGATNTLGTDTSQWQGWEPNLHGTAFTIIQSNFGTSVEPSAVTQMRNAAFDGVTVGCYSFGEPGVSGAATARVAAAVCTKARGRKAGLWFDAELNGVYQHECEYVAEAKRLGATVAGKYSSPGLDQGHRCEGYLWPAEWGSAPYAYGGYPFSDVLLYQFCGTCHLHGVEFDLDRSLGLLSHLEQPKPKPVPLGTLYRRRRALRGLLAKHHCRQPPWHAATPPTAGHACHVWLAQGAQTNRAIRAKGGR